MSEPTLSSSPLVLKDIALTSINTHTGFPYSAIDQACEVAGTRNSERLPRFASIDTQIVLEF
jgi:hypothetical protein